MRRGFRNKWRDLEPGSLVLLIVIKPDPGVDPVKEPGLGF